MNSTEVENHLKDVALAQYSFKGDKLRAVGNAIAHAFDVAPRGEVWADEVTLPELAAEDKNVIGTAWKNLGRWRIICRLGDRRRSKKNGRRGGEVAKYMLLSRPLLNAFMKANHCEIKPAQYKQQDLV